ncbi:MAG: adenylate kinase [Chloroflexi bacterium]|nr:adenylate kinase [Chloroflexota bacterium]MCY3937741.1 adenylate kinase [Chloroflexota bacterium]
MTEFTDLYIMLGPPNSGKGTQAASMAAKLDMHHLSSGDAFREAVASGSQVGRLAGSYIEAGDLVPDDVVIDVILERLENLSADGCGTILDGFPRTTEQAQALDQRIGRAGLKILAVVSIEVGQDELLRRAALRGRDDDRPEVARRRFEVYEQLTLPLTEYYERCGLLVRIDGESPIEVVTSAILDSVMALTS